MKRAILWALIYLTIAIGSFSCSSSGSIAPGPFSWSKAITSYSFLNPRAIGNINESDKTITVTVPYGTDVTEVIATFTTTGKSVKVGGTVQVSGITTNDFTNPVVYIVTAADGSTSKYTVSVDLGSQPKTAWVQRYSINTSDVDWDQPTAMVVDASGNVYVTGGGMDVSSGQSYGYATIKYDVNGNQVWVNRYDAWDWAKSMVVDTSGNVYVTGQPATIKYDSNGTMVWTNGYGYSDMHGVSLKIDKTENIYVTGWKMNPENKNDAVTTKYAPNGTLLWTQTHHETGRYLLFKSVIIDSWGNIIAAGLSEKAGGADFKYIITKYDPAGTVLWTSYANGATGFATSQNISLAVDPLGNIYVAGGIVEPSMDVNSSDYGLIKYDKDGNQIWMSRYSGPGGYIDYATGLALDSQGSIVVTGFSWGQTTDWDYATIKYDSNGNQLWVRTFNNGRDSAEAIAIDQMDNVYITGGIWGPLGYATVRYDTNGNQSWIAYYGGSAEAEGWAIAIALDTTGNVYVAGYSKGASTNYDFATIKYVQ